MTIFNYKAIHSREKAFNRAYVSAGASGELLESELDDGHAAV